MKKTEKCFQANFLFFFFDAARRLPNINFYFRKRAEASIKEVMENARERDIKFA